MKCSIHLPIAELLILKRRGVRMVWLWLVLSPEQPRLRLLFCPLPPSLIPSVPLKKRGSFQKKMGHYVLLNILRIISSHGTWQLRKYSNNLYFVNNLGLLLTSRNADMICFSWYICFLCVSVNLCELSFNKYNLYFYQNVKLSN